MWYLPNSNKSIQKKQAETYLSTNPGHHLVYTAVGLFINEIDILTGFLSWKRAAIAPEPLTALVLGITCEQEFAPSHHKPTPICQAPHCSLFQPVPSDSKPAGFGVLGLDFPLSSIQGMAHAWCSPAILTLYPGLPGTAENCCICAHSQPKWDLCHRAT